MTYSQATEYLFSRRAMGMKLGLENVRRLLECIGNPQRSFPSVHVAGTNGKGSTVAILESILRRAGYRTGRFTSPHLIDMRERIRVGGTRITPREVVESVQVLRPHIESTGATFFEILTAMAFRHFQRNRIDIAVLETGLGGRLDATNLVTPILTIITEISRDHTRILGKDIESIAREKAGMLKPGIPCLCGATRRRARDFFRKYTADNAIPLLFSRDAARLARIRLSEGGSAFDLHTRSASHRNLDLNLLGRHQVDNAVLAVLAVEELMEQGWPVPGNALRDGLKDVSWPARLQLLPGRPKKLLDSAHNPSGASRLAAALTDIFEYDRLILCFGVLRDKDYRAMINRLAPLADHLVLTKPLSDRALEPEKLVRLKSLRDRSTVILPDISEAWRHALGLAGDNDMVCAAGSIHLVGEILRIRESHS